MMGRGSGGADYRYVLAAAVLAMALFAARSTAAQDTTDVPQQSQSNTNTNKAFSVKGELGAFGELYDISGQEPRRPSSTGRLFMRSTITAWGSVSASLNLMLSSEGSSARQDINQLDFNPRWGWGQAHLGDFCEELTPLTMSGIRVRGGGVILTPGKWRLALLSGMTTRSVGTETSSRSYERSITGVKLGYGANDGTSFELNFLNARDKLNSIADATVDTSSSDTAVMDFEQNPVSITPQENLVISAAMNLVFARKKVKWRNEFGAAAITRDRRSPELDNSGVPDFVTNLFTPRKSSGVDYAYTSDLRWDIRQVSLTAGYHYIGPGYVSLGLASLISDKQEITAGATVRFRGGQVRLDGALQQDNLIHQKSYTTDRARITTMLVYRLRPNWNATVGVTYTGMANDSRSDTTRIDYSSWILRTGHQFTFQRQIGLRSISADYTHQRASDNNPLRHSSGTNSNSVSLVATCAVSSSLEVVPSIGLIGVKVGGNRTLTQTYTAAARHTALQRRLVSSAALAVSVGDVTTTLRPSLRSSYEFHRNYTLAAELESTMVKGGAASAQFDEIAGRLMFTRRF